MQFKKHISLFLAILFLVSNLGLAINVHFCKDKIESISLFDLNSNCKTHDNCCKTETKFPSCCKKIEKKKDCCDNKIIKSDSNSEKIITPKINVHFEAFIISNQCILVNYYSKTICKSSKHTTYICNANAPPIFEQNCQLLFYA